MSKKTPIEKRLARLREFSSTSVNKHYRKIVLYLEGVIEGKICDKVLVRNKDGTSEIVEIPPKISDRNKAAEILKKVSIDKYLPDKKDDIKESDKTPDHGEALTNIHKRRMEAKKKKKKESNVVELNPPSEGRKGLQKPPLYEH